MVATDYVDQLEAPDEQMWQEMAVAQQKLLELEEIRIKIRGRLGMVTLISVSCVGLMFIGTILHFNHNYSGQIAGLSIISLFLGLFSSVASGMQVYVLTWELRKSAQLQHRLKDAVDEASANSAYPSMERG